jgi:hypothetical protein
LGGATCPVRRGSSAGCLVGLAGLLFGNDLDTAVMLKLVRDQIEQLPLAVLVLADLHQMIVPYRFFVTARLLDDCQERFGPNTLYSKSEFAQQCFCRRS